MVDSMRPREGSIDLGEDLLESTATSTKDSSAAEPMDLDDALKSAEILQGEGLTDEAKGILRKILIRDANHIRARQLLAEIHELELKQIFSRSETPLDLSGKKLKVPERSDPDTILTRLNEEFGLQLDVTEFDGLNDELTLFQDAEARTSYISTLSHQLSGVSARDRIDLGVGFLNMGLAEVALSIFDGAQRVMGKTESPSGDLELVIAYLISYSLLAMHRPFDAACALEPILKNVEIEEARKIDLYYLLGQAHQELKQADIARAYFERVFNLNPYYRDVGNRIKK